MEFRHDPNFFGNAVTSLRRSVTPLRQPGSGAHRTTLEVVRLRRAALSLRATGHALAGEQPCTNCLHARARMQGSKRRGIKIASHRRSSCNAPLHLHVLCNTYVLRCVCFRETPLLHVHTLHLRAFTPPRQHFCPPQSVPLPMPCRRQPCTNGLHARVRWQRSRGAAWRSNPRRSSCNAPLSLTCITVFLRPRKIVLACTIIASQGVNLKWQRARTVPQHLAPAMDRCSAVVGFPRPAMHVPLSRLPVCLQVNHMT